MSTRDQWFLILALHFFVSAPCIGYMCAFVLQREPGLFRFVSGGITATGLYILVIVARQAIFNAFVWSENSK